MTRVWHRVQLSTGVLFDFDCSLGITPESPDWAGIHYLGQAGLEPVSTLLLSLPGAGLQVCATTSNGLQYLRVLSPAG